MSVNQKLQALSDEHAAEVSALTDRACDAARAAYQALEGEPEATRYRKLKAAITGAVEGARRSARDAAASHVLAELRVIVTGKSLPSIAIARDPLPAEVAEYIDNAVDAAREADESGKGFVSTSWWSDRVIESEAFRTYDEGRRVAEQSLVALSDEEAERYGFKVANKQSQLTKEFEGIIALIGKRWSAVNDISTCQRCAAMHGSLALLGMSFHGSGNPPIHARCRCVTHLWSVGYVEGQNMSEQVETRVPEQLARYAAPIEDRTIDVESRVIYGAIASDESIDSHNSIIKVNGWDLEQFKRNPVLLWMHKSGGAASPEPADVLGRVEARIEKKRLVVDLHFPPEGKNPKADMVFGQIQRGELNSLSVGFKPKRYHFAKLSEDSDDETLIIEKQQLVELSVVIVGSNGNALIKQVRDMFGETKTEACPCVGTREDALDPVHAGDADNNVREQKPLVGKEIVTMSDNKVTGIPAGLAAVLGTEDVEEAKRKFAKSELRIAQLEEERDQAKAEAQQARAELDKYRNEAADQAVNELVGLGLIKEDNRKTAQAFARSDLAGFTEMYSEARANLAKKAAPKAHLLETVVENKRETKPRPLATGEFARKHRELSRKILKDNPRMEPAEAYQRAFEELTSADK